VRKLTEKNLVIASHNNGKIMELRALVEPLGYTVSTAAELGLDEPEETGATYEDNARLKALTAARTTGRPALADDSGLSVDALDGAPGVRSARWAGEGRDFSMAMRKVIAKLDTMPGSDRGARFVSVICMAWPDGHCDLFRGEVAGTIVPKPRGRGGFGYDPIFMPEGHDRTFGQMEASEKGALSHRSRAFAKFAGQCLVHPQET